MTRTRAEEGGATLLVLWTAMLLFAAGTIATLWSAISLATHRATSAADLTALSTAQAIQAGSPDPCAVARDIATTNRATLTTCTLTSDTATIKVAIALDLGVLGAPTLTSTSRAGPTDNPAPEAN
ncbi:Rv3654c family TadE-like protein [Kribbella lupini]|uniref:Secretion/DNA translocation related TadE-like protein n=1 Tax=Kribbella lupini TaxID=291602 RepID=A0ABN2B8W8_9ACTN